MRIGVLTAGGDAPGLNAAIRAIVEFGHNDGHDIIGIADGWAGLVDELRAGPLTRDDVSDVVGVGGTLLGTTRFDLDHPSGGRDAVLATIEREFDVVIAIGGDGTQGISHWLAERGAPIVGVPKTLDNDLPGTEYSIGFDSAVNFVANSLDRLATTASSHHRVMVVETMGRSTGWVATLGGMAGGANLIVVPEFTPSLDEIVARIERRHAAGHTATIVVVAEGVDLPGDDGPGGAGHRLGHHVATASGYEVRTTVLGHLQRGGSPTAFDRIWATRVGARAYLAAREGLTGTIAVVREGRADLVDLAECATGPRAVPREVYELADAFCRED